MLKLPFKVRQRPKLYAIIFLSAVLLELYDNQILSYIFARNPITILGQYTQVIINLASFLIIVILLFYIIAGFFEKMVLTETELLSVHNFRKRSIQVVDIRKIIMSRRWGGFNIGTDPFAVINVYGSNSEEPIIISFPTSGRSREQKDRVAIIKYLLEKNPAIETDEVVRASLN